MTPTAQPMLRSFFRNPAANSVRPAWHAAFAEEQPAQQIRPFAHRMFQQQLDQVVARTALLAEDRLFPLSWGRLNAGLAVNHGQPVSASRLSSASCNGRCPANNSISSRPRFFVQVACDSPARRGKSTAGRGRPSSAMCQERPRRRRSSFYRHRVGLNFRVAGGSGRHSSVSFRRAGRGRKHAGAHHAFSRASSLVDTAVSASRFEVVSKS